MYTIGEFSRIGNVSARMLRHYDRLGLLRPASVGENGYSYYDPAQLAVLRQIEALKSYGFALSEVGRLLPLAPDALAREIHKRRLRAYEELAQLRGTLRRMEDEIIQMEGNSMSLDKYHVILMENPAQNVFGLRRTINVSETHQLFQELKSEMEARGLTRNGPTQRAYMGETFDYDNMDVEAQVEVAEQTAETHTLPACRCVATVHTGPYETVKYAYEAIGEYLAAHPELEVCGPAIERYIKDEEMAKSPEELETGILFPVAEVKPEGRDK